MIRDAELHRAPPRVGRSRAVALAAAVGGCLGLAWTEADAVAERAVFFRDSGGFAFLVLSVPVLVAVWVPFAWLLFSAAGLPRPGLTSSLGAAAACLLGFVLLCLALAITELDMGRLAILLVCVASTAGGYAAVAALVRPPVE